MQDDNSESTAPEDAEAVESAVAEQSAETSAEEAEAAGEPEEPSEVANTIASMGLTRMSLQELKDKAPADLLAFAEVFEIENANPIPNQDIIFPILTPLPEKGVPSSCS